MKKFVILFFVLNPFIFSCKEQEVAPESGKVVSFIVKKGEPFTLFLPLKSSPGSTGVSWQLSKIQNNNLIFLEKQEEVINPSGSSFWGTQVWSFTAINKGSVRLEFDFIRPTVKDEVYDKQIYKIEITN